MWYHHVRHQHVQKHILCDVIYMMCSCTKQCPTQTGVAEEEVKKTVRISFGFHHHWHKMDLAPAAVAMSSARRQGTTDSLSLKLCKDTVRRGGFEA